MGTIFRILSKIMSKSEFKMTQLPRLIILKFYLKIFQSSVIRYSNLLSLIHFFNVKFLNKNKATRLLTYACSYRHILDWTVDSNGSIYVDILSNEQNKLCPIHYRQQMSSFYCHCCFLKFCFSCCFFFFLWFLQSFSFKPIVQTICGFLLPIANAFRNVTKAQKNKAKNEKKVQETFFLMISSCVTTFLKKIYRLSVCMRKEENK